MKCADPVLCYINGKGQKTYRNFSLASAVELRREHVSVFNCGKCISCRKKSAYELASRCVLHASLYKDSAFLTLTYDEKLETYHNTFNYPEIQKFKKDLRQYVNTAEYSHIKTRKLKRRRNPKWLYRKIEIFNVHEYGKNGKKHWHLIVFNYDFDDKTIHTKSNGRPLYTSKNLEELWPYGFNTIGDVSEASAMYQAQYMEKDIKNNNVNNSKKSHSKHSGIGKPYFLKHYKQILQLGYVPINGGKLPAPRYFEKLAHKHWCHYNEPSAFHDLKHRKRLYTKFKPNEANLEISKLFQQYSNAKKARLPELEKEWNDFINQHIIQKEQADFQKSASNKLYDLQNRNNQERF